MKKSEFIKKINVISEEEQFGFTCNRVKAVLGISAGDYYFEFIKPHLEGTTLSIPIEEYVGRGRDTYAEYYFPLRQLLLSSFKEECLRTNQYLKF